MNGGRLMAVNDNKRFYWLKLKKDFFQQHQIKVLKSLPNGRLYALIYLELLAESCSHDGELRYSKMLPYDVITLSAVIDEDKDNVEKAIETFINLELVEMLDDGTIFMREIQRLIGSETGQTIRKRDAKLAQGKSVVKITQENRDKRLEIRDKNKFIPPTLEEVRSYCEERKNNVDAQKFIDYYSSNDWKDSRGKNVINWKQKLIANWEKDRSEDIVYDTSKGKQLSREETDRLLALRYDDSKNKKMTEEEESELLALMGK